MKFIVGVYKESADNSNGKVIKACLVYDNHTKQVSELLSLNTLKNMLAIGINIMGTHLAVGVDGQTKIKFTQQNYDYRSLAEVDEFSNLIKPGLPVIVGKRKDGKYASVDYKGNIQYVDKHDLNWYSYLGITKANYICKSSSEEVY